MMDSFVGIGRRAGARLVEAGDRTRRWVGPRFFYAPTLLDEVRPDMPPSPRKRSSAVWCAADPGTRYEQKGIEVNNATSLRAMKLDTYPGLNAAFRALVS